MGFVGDIVGKVGNMFGFGGGMNQFQAKAPTNDFQAQGQGIDFASAIKNAMTGANGISAQQQSLVNALQSQAAGNGPSIAQPMLQQATDQNTQQAAGLMGSQRGMNAGLQGRQIAQQRAGIQQQGAQGMALLRNQEQLGAQGMLGQTLGTMGQQNLGMLGTAGHLGAQDWWNTQQLNQATAAQNAGLNLGAQEINAGVSKQNADISSKAWAGAINGLSGGMGHLSMGGGGGGGADMLSQGGDAFAAYGASRGGEVPPVHAAFGAMIRPQLRPQPMLAPRPAAPAPQPGGMMGGVLGAMQPRPTAPLPAPGGIFGAVARQAAPHPSIGGMLGGLFAGGGAVPGQAPVAGDSDANDIVDAELSPGEIVLPRSIAQSENAPEMAAEFVRAIRRKHYAQGGVACMANGGQVPPAGFGKVLAIQREHANRLKLLESKLMSKRDSKKIDKYAEGK
jgi:hypothetical protein